VQGTVLLGMGIQPKAVWRFEAVMVLLSGHWPPRGLLSGSWPPRSAALGQADAEGCASGSDSCGGSPYDSRGIHLAGRRKARHLLATIIPRLLRS
jgi:hypothetical protein